jgi:serine/threonine protein kinase
VLEDGTIVAVKRLKDTTTTATGGGVAGGGGGTIISSSNFQKQITSMGRLQHPNVVPLRAYYFSKDEKLLVYDFYSNGSLSSFLHGK